MLFCTSVLRFADEIQIQFKLAAHFWRTKVNAHYAWHVWIIVEQRAMTVFAIHFRLQIMNSARPAKAIQGATIAK